MFILSGGMYCTLKEIKPPGRIGDLFHHVFMLEAKLVAMSDPKPHETNKNKDNEVPRCSSAVADNCSSNVTSMKKNYDSFCSKLRCLDNGRSARLQFRQSDNISTPSEFSSSDVEIGNVVHKANPLIASNSSMPNEFSDDQKMVLNRVFVRITNTILFRGFNSWCTRVTMLRLIADMMLGSSDEEGDGCI